eukprot:COSAG04_NODE_5328_length_1655_cov_0.922879_2_plen_198_part_00
MSSLPAALQLRGGTGQSIEEDKAALLAFKAGGDEDGDLASWDAATSPCGVGWDSLTAGWAGVMCCESYGEWNGAELPCQGSNTGRVTMLDLWNTDGLAGTLEALAPLTALTYLELGSCDNVGGELSGVAGLTQLEYLYLDGTSVSGEDGAVTKWAARYDVARDALVDGTWRGDAEGVFEATRRLQQGGADGAARFET